MALKSKLRHNNSVLFYLKHNSNMPSCTRVKAEPLRIKDKRTRVAANKQIKISIVCLNRRPWRRRPLESDSSSVFCSASFAKSTFPAGEGYFSFKFVLFEPKKYSCCFAVIFCTLLAPFVVGAIHRLYGASPVYMSYVCTNLLRKNCIKHIPIRFDEFLKFRAIRESPLQHTKYNLLKPENQGV